MPRSTVRFAFI